MSVQTATRLEQVRGRGADAQRLLAAAASGLVAAALLGRVSQVESSVS